MILLSEKIQSVNFTPIDSSTHGTMFLPSHTTTIQWQSTKTIGNSPTTRSLSIKSRLMLTSLMSVKSLSVLLRRQARKMLKRLARKFQEVLSGWKTVPSGSGLNHPLKHKPKEMQEWLSLKILESKPMLTKMLLWRIFNE